MTTRRLYGTQGGGTAEIIGRHAYFTEELNVPGAYHYNAGDRVPDEWDLIPFTAPDALESSGYSPFDDSPEYHQQVD